MLLLVFCEANGRVLNLPLLKDMNVHVQFVLLLLSLGLLIVGASGMLRWTLRLPRVDWRIALMLGLITALAIFLRYWDLQYGLRQFVDEVNFASVVDGFWDRPTVPLMQAMSGVIAFPYLYPYWESMAVDLLGHNMLGLRAVSALLGALTIPAIYLLGRAAFDRKTGLLAALLLATFPPHLHFSRLALNNIADPLFGTLALAFLVRGLRWNRRLDYVLGGVMLGLTHYFYEGGRLVFTPLIIAWLIGLAYLWFPRFRWRQLVPALLMALLVALPIYYTLVAVNSSLAARLDANHQALGGDYWDQVSNTSGGLQRHIQTHIVRPILLMLRDVEGSVFYRGEYGLVPPLLVPFLLLGLGYVILRLRNPGPLLLLGWCITVIAGNSVMVASDHSPRYVVIFPALMLLVAVGLRALWPLLTPRRGRWLLFGVLALALGAYQANYYFNVHLPLYKAQILAWHGHRDGGDVLFRSLTFPPDTGIHVISDPPDDKPYLGGALHFLHAGMHLDTLKPSQVTAGYLAALPPEDQAFFIDPGSTALLARIQRYYYLLPPQYSPFADIPVDAQFVLYYAPYLGEYSDNMKAHAETLHHLPQLHPIP